MGKALEDRETGPANRMVKNTDKDERINIADININLKQPPYPFPF
jgi:hypothetical protein